MPATRRLWITIAAVAAGIVLLLLIAIPFLLNVDNYRPRIQRALSDATGRSVTLGHLSFSLFSGALTADQLAIADDPAFSQQPFIKAQSVHIGIQVGPLLFHKQLQIRSITIESPQIQLIRNQANVWNYASLGNAKKRGNSAETQSAMPNLTIGSLEVTNGQVSVTQQGDSSKPAVYQNVAATITDFSLTTPFDYSVSASLPGNGNFSVSGKGGPFNQADASKTPLNAKVQVKHADLVGASLVPPSAGISGYVDLNANVTSNGETAHVTGTMDAAQLKLVAAGSPAPRPVHVNFTVDQDLNSLSGRLGNSTINFDKAVLNLNGTYRTQGATTTLDVHAGGQGVPINDLETFLPSVGVQLPSGSRLQGGTLTTALSITGPSQNPVIAGPVRIDNTQLAGFDLGSKLSAVSKLTGAHTGNVTTIQVLSANVRAAGGGVQLANIVCVVPGLGSAVGNGTISASQQLNFHLVAKLDQSGAGGVATAALSMIGGGVGGAASGALKNGIPVTITGTSSNPVFTPDVKGLAGGAVNPSSILGNATKQGIPTKGLGNGLGNALGGLLNKH
jgi:AsmA protein